MFNVAMRLMFPHSTGIYNKNIKIMLQVYNYKNGKFTRIGIDFQVDENDKLNSITSTYYGVYTTILLVRLTAFIIRRVKSI